jgi:hypothetical protein
MIELPVSAQAIQQVQRLFDAAAQGGKLECIEQEGGSKIFYIKQPLRSSEDFLNKILYGKPGPGRAAPVLRLVVDANAGRIDAREHVHTELPELFSSAPAEALKQRSLA